MLTCNGRGCEGCVDGACTKACYPGCEDCKNGFGGPASIPSGKGVETSGGAADKLLLHDEYARSAVRYLIDWLRDDPEPLLAMARGRHAEGHFRYGDALMFEHDQGTLLAEAAQELADAVCYLALFLRRAASPG